MIAKTEKPGLRERMRARLRPTRRADKVDEFWQLTAMSGFLIGIVVGAILLAWTTAALLIWPDKASANWGSVVAWGVVGLIACAGAMYFNRRAVRQSNDWKWIVERLERARGERED